MPWNVERAPRQGFARNPLSVVIAQVRFHPILKVPDRISDFQERVRTRFPAYQQRIAHSVEIRDVAGVRVDQEQQFVFQAPDDALTLFVSAKSLALESRTHRDRDTFQAGFGLALTAFREVFGGVAPTRVGLRYVNSIRREQIGRDLGRDVPWDDLVTAGFLRVPGEPQIGDDTQFAGEVTSGMAPSGRLTLRYGLIAAPGGAPAEFRLDLDRYTEEGIDAQRLPETLNLFADDIFSVFWSSMGPALAEWMRGNQE